MSEHDLRRCALPVVEIILYRIPAYSDYSFSDARWWPACYRSEKPFWLPTTYGEIYSLMTRFRSHTEQLILPPESTVTEIVDHSRILLDSELPQSSFEVDFFLQRGSRRFAADEKIKDIVKMTEGNSLWLMCKHIVLRDEDMVMHDPKERSMLRMRLSQRETYTLDGTRLQTSSKMLKTPEEQSLEQRADSYVFPKKVTKQDLGVAETDSQLPVATSSVSARGQETHTEDAPREPDCCSGANEVRRGERTISASQNRLSNDSKKSQGTTTREISTTI